MTTLDFAVILVYFVGIAAYGIWVSRNMKGSEGYFLGNRKFRWWTMMGQAFGTGTHAEMPVAQTGACFQLGFATIWYQWKNMLITPFYWLIAPWYRRSNAVTTGEMLSNRYGRSMGLFYSIFAILFLVFTMGTMLQGAAKVISIASGGEITSNTVVIAMTLAFMVYSFIGGLTAAAHTELIQGLLIVVLSFMLIPLGLRDVGGFSEMRSHLPTEFFGLYSEASGLGAFTIAMLAINGIVGITAQPHMMSVMSTGNTELACRIGQTYGTFVKRFITIGWAFTGLIVATMVIQRGAVLEDPEFAFGYAARELLAPGLVGLLVACILAANMSTCSNFMVGSGALFTRDIYKPYVNAQITDAQELRLGRMSGLILTSISVLFALVVGNVLSAFLFVETIAAFMGIAIFGGVIWKRANRYGAIAAVVVAFVAYYIINFSDTGTLQLIYTWQPAPFGKAILAGFSTLVIVSLLTKPEPAETAGDFFDKMNHLAPDDRPKGQNPTAKEMGRDLILLDVGTWFKRERWVGFKKRYREDLGGFLLAWLMVGFLIFVAWLLMQIH
ncbi:MAG: sodium:solute symporter family protein [Saprospiraceae bacterium]|nr:sodium:solute symporter family protein [Saprospiraceae bacterium]